MVILLSQLRTSFRAGRINATFAVVLHGSLLIPAGIARRAHATIMVDVAQLAGTRLPAHLPVVGQPVPRQGNLTQRNISK